MIPDINSISTARGTAVPCCRHRITSCFSCLSQCKKASWLQWFGCVSLLSPLLLKPFSIGHPEKGYVPLIYMARSWPCVRWRKNLTNRSESPVYILVVFTEALPFTKESPCPTMLNNILSYTPLSDYLCQSPR